ncbi:MAG TPA: EMC3/TMCO1 family protein [Thermoplasmata archaeon]|nr:EMC3/TMCO1 family protein [Thermoplasmata archaeon]
MLSNDAPLRSTTEVAAPEDVDDTPVSGTSLAEEETEDASPPEEPEAAPVRPPAPRPAFKISTFIIVFLGLLGFLMLIETSTRNSIAGALGTSLTTPGPLFYLIGFSSQYLLATMALAGALEMAITALAYNYTTDWTKAARVQKWNAAFRKVQMEAVRSGKKDRIAALKPFQERITRLSSEVTIAQFKGMAITYFLLILIYTWVGLVIENATAAQQTVNLGGSLVNIYTFHVFGYFPLWFLIFSLYTVPASMVFRRVLKHWWLRRHAEKNHIVPAPPAPPAGSAA